MLDFEKPILELEGKISELRNVSSDSEVNIAEDIDALPRHYQLATLRYERILCQESSAERLARQVTALTQQG